jgi:hypothetical protein
MQNMKKIGTTSSGSVIVEMTAAQFEALSQLQPAPITEASTAQPDVAKMTTTEKVAYVRERIMKLKPKKKDGVARSISAMFQFNGGIEEQELQKIIGCLQKENVFTFDEVGRVTYRKA